MSESEARLSQRHPVETIKDLKRVSEESGLSQVALVGASLRALIKTWDDQGELTFPFRVIPESVYFSKVFPRQGHLKVADEEEEYRTD